MESYCRVTKESIGGAAGSLLRLRAWQKALVRDLLTERPDGRLLYRRALVGVARKNTKSTLGAGLALFGLVLGKSGTEIYGCAGDKEQAKIVFGTAKSMVEIDPELRKLIHTYKDALEVIGTGSVYRVLSAEAPRQEGLNPNMVIFDEVHVQPNDELWNVMSLASGARTEPLMLGITTAGVMSDRLGQDSLCYRLYKYGVRLAEGEEVDPTFFFAWWEPKDGSNADHRDPQVWAEANPGIGDLVSLDDFHSSLRTTPEAEFRTKRTNIFVSAANAWLPYGAWDSCLNLNDELRDGERVVLGFDGSYNNDSTAIVAARVGARPFVQTVKVWEKPVGTDPDWTVPIEEVEGIIIAACQKWRVKEIAADPARWEKSLQYLANNKGLPVVEFPQSPERMIPATQRFYEAVMNRLISHGTDGVLGRHLQNCVIKLTERGGRVVKQTKGSPAKIDAAVAAIMAYDRAAGPQGVGAGWMQAWNAETTALESQGAKLPEPTVQPSRTNSPSPRDILLGPGRPLPTPRDICMHRWHPVDKHPETGTPMCVFCGSPKKKE